jgi:signal transduction histidine kinase
MMLRRSDGSEIPTELVITRISRDGPAMFTAFIRDVTMERRTREALAGSEQRLRNLAARLQEAIEEERTRIAREIHDELGQQLTALKLDLAWILRRYETGDRSAVDERLTAMANLVDATAETVRRLATGLRPGILDDLGVVPALEWQAREFETRTGICVDLTLPDDDDLDVPAEHATAFFRILQELLTNVTRHAKAKTVRICLEQDEGDLVLEVQDDGRGISAAETASGGSLGLVGMRERVGLLRGRIDFEGTPGAGTKVTTRVPLRVVASAR